MLRAHGSSITPLPLLREEQEAGAIAYVVNDTTGDDLAWSRADADRSRHGSQGEIESAGTARQIGSRGHGGNAEGPRPGAVHYLDNQEKNTDAILHVTC